MSTDNKSTYNKKATGIGNPVAIISCEHPGTVEDARCLLEAVGYTSFANFDIKIDPRTGAYYFFEINTRLGRSNYHMTASCHNVATWIVDDLVNNREFSDDTVIARGDESLYTVVPRSTLLAYVQNPELKAEIRRLCAEGKATDPIDYAAEERLIRRIYPKIFPHKQKKAFAAAFRAAATSAAPGAASARTDASAASAPCAGRSRRQLAPQHARGPRGIQAAGPAHQAAVRTRRAAADLTSKPTPRRIPP